MFCPMDPPITSSVHRVAPHLWHLGSSIVCERIENSDMAPDESIAHWKDGNDLYYLREKTSEEDLSASPGDCDTDRIHQGGTSGATWSIGQTGICKAKAWREGIELEATTIRFVQTSDLGIPVPEIIHSWIDRKINRSFIVMKRVPGQMLDTIWPQLSAQQRQQLADTIVSYIVKLATKTSPRLETISGLNVHEPYLNSSIPFEHPHPSWKPRLFGPFTSAELTDFMADNSSAPPPKIDDLFHLYHADLGPTNIMVSDDGNNITAVLDWEIVAYFPRFWIATKMESSGGYRLSGDDVETYEWAEMLADGLEANGYERQNDVFNEWKKSSRRRSN